MSDRVPVRHHTRRKPRRKKNQAPALPIPAPKLPSAPKGRGKRRKSTGQIGLF